MRIDVAAIQTAIRNNVVVSSETGCWIWQGYLSSAVPGLGYGKMCVDGKQRYTHRLSFAAFCNLGKMPEQMVCHTCDVRACCSPFHLFHGAPADNARDMWAKGRARPGRVSGDEHYARTSPERLARGEKHGNAKLDVAMVKEIRELLNQQISHRAIGKLFNVSKYAIWSVANGMTWSHVK